MHKYCVWFVNQYGVTQQHQVEAYSEVQARAWTIQYWGENIQIYRITTCD